MNSSSSWSESHCNAVIISSTTVGTSRHALQEGEYEQGHLYEEFDLHLKILTKFCNSNGH